MHLFQMSHLRVNGLLLQKRIGLDVEGLTDERGRCQLLRLDLIDLLDVNDGRLVGVNLETAEIIVLIRPNDFVLGFVLLLGLF